MDEQELAISVEEVDRTYTVGQNRVHALRNVTLSIRHGSFVVLMGPSGSGKTTLLNLIGGLDTPTIGSVCVEGQRLELLSQRALVRVRRRIGFIFQSFALLPTASAYENVEMGLRLVRNIPRREWDMRIRRCLRAVELTAWSQHRPYELSGGQQQRVAIARALAIRPKIILADEPTGDLDRVTGVHILELLRALVDQEGITLVMATHDPAVVPFATAVYLLHDGQLVG